MSNESITLFRAWSKKFTKDKQALEPDAGAKTVLNLIDHFNGLHWHDRNRSGDDVRELAAQVQGLARRLDSLERRLPTVSKHSYEEQPR